MAATCCCRGARRVLAVLLIVCCSFVGATDTATPWVSEPTDARIQLSIRSVAPGVVDAFSRSGTRSGSCFEAPIAAAAAADAARRERDLFATFEVVARRCESGLDSIKCVTETFFSRGRNSEEMLADLGSCDRRPWELPWQKLSEAKASLARAGVAASDPVAPPASLADAVAAAQAPLRRPVHPAVSRYVTQSQAVCRFSRSKLESLRFYSTRWSAMAQMLQQAAQHCAEVPLVCINMSDSCVEAAEAETCFRTCLRTGNMRHELG